jgi:hypothetical protein
MSGTDPRTQRILAAAEAFVRAMRVPETGSLAEWRREQQAAYERLIDTVEGEQAIDATDS